MTIRTEYLTWDDFFSHFDGDTALSGECTVRGRGVEDIIGQRSPCCGGLVWRHVDADCSDSAVCGCCGHDVVVEDDDYYDEDEDAA